jgi:hypothetical protein
MSTEIVPHVVYHMAAMNDYQPIVREQMLALRTSGLGAALAAIGDRVAITHVGPDPHWVLEEAARQDVPARLVKTDPNVTHYETFAMLEIERLVRSKVDDRPVLYHHSKGASAPNDPVKSQWRATMTWHVIEHWRHRMIDLVDHDAAGFNWWWHGPQHFSGTFWVANQDWLRKLPDFAPWHVGRGADRYSCELWIGAPGTCRAKSLGCSDQRTWYPGYDWGWLTPPEKPAGDTITWVSGATPGYAKDLANVQRSAGRLGPGHSFVAVHLDDRGTWKHSRKLDCLLEVADRAQTSHVAWIDADCEFLTRLPPSDFIDSTKSLFAVRHIGFNSPRAVLPGKYRDAIKTNRNVYHQACLFGGTRAAVRDLVLSARQLLGPEGGYDEHALNVFWDEAGPSKLQTLPTRYNWPSSFARIPDHEGECHARAGGAPRVLHANREVHR